MLTDREIREMTAPPLGGQYRASGVELIGAGAARNKSTDVTNDMSKKLLTKVATAIHHSCNNAELHTTVYCSEFKQQVIDLVIKTLKEKNYTAKHESGSDQRDGTSWSYIQISW